MKKLNLKSYKLRWMLSLVALLLVTNSFAHQQREAYTTLSFNQQSGLLEVTHRVLIHDAEHILAQLVEHKKLGLSSDLVNDRRSQRVFAEYIESSFSVADNKEKPLALRMIGFEVEEKFLWVYQESLAPSDGGLLIKHSAMQEFWPDHINHINVERNGEVQSIRLKKSDLDQWRLVSLPNLEKAEQNRKGIELGQE